LCHATVADVAKGNETVEWACALPEIGQGKRLEVSRNIICHDHRAPLGVVASIVPFNFPFMVPMWTVPIALVMGNCVILKPSEKVPLTMRYAADLFIQAGVPPGVFQMVNGAAACCSALMESPSVRAVTFVGSSPIANIVATKCRTLNKRVTSLGGAKNHLVALEDCSNDDTTRDVVASAFGAAGQRCMAASVLLIVGENKELIDNVVAKASQIKLGQKAGELGPVIDTFSKTKIFDYIADSEKNGAKVLLDGRALDSSDCKGNWMGPTVILHSNKTDKALHDEIFGPVLSILQVDSWQEAIDIENGSPFGNAACIYTSKGGNADWFISRFRAGMLGVNVGIPVPREPFAFGGLYGTLSKYGDMDITGEGAMEFFSNRIKVTTRWPTVEDEPAFKRGKVEQRGGAEVVDQANFNGKM
jgi:acyl-CoA reductase-like NAD-dependent aldehyde dehydrogenase